MQIQQIRNATMRINYSGKRLITDPYLADKHELPSYTGKSPNPVIDLPFSAQDVIKGIEAVLVSHIHSDHFDPAGQKLLPKNLPLFCQPSDEDQIKKMGFGNVIPVGTSVNWERIEMIRTQSQHGTGDVLKQMGKTSGFLLKAQGEPTVYWVGDSIFCDAVAEVIDMHQPDIILTHSCGAVWGDNVPIIMDAKQTIEVCRRAPKAVVIATHMESLDHATVSRADLRALAESEKIGSKQLLIPDDGEILHF